jgi:hypothetical protein
MSGMYNVIFGENPAGKSLVELLQTVQPVEVGRYRDAWVERKGDSLAIRVHTRNGGGNRESYDDPSMQAHPWYICDEDDSFDSTYADYWFRIDVEAISKEYPELVTALMNMAVEPVDMPARWKAAIDKLGKQPIREAKGFA